MVVNGSTLVYLGINGSKVSKWFEDGLNGSDGVLKGNYGSKWTHMGLNGFKWV